jgi:hypothetical protein
MSMKQTTPEKQLFDEGNIQKRECYFTLGANGFKPTDTELLAS